MASLLWLPVVGWLVAPIISLLVNKLLSYIDFNLSRKLDELRFNVIPSLEQILGDVTEQRMLRGAKEEGKGSGSVLKTLGELEKKLKFALYDADDVLDLVDYRKIEKKVICGDRKSQATSISSRVLQAIGDCIACCKQSSFGEKLWDCVQNLSQKLRYLGEKLQQCAQDLDLKFWKIVDILKQYAQTLKQKFRVQSLPLYLRQEAPEQPSVQESATTPSLTPECASSNPPPRNSAGSATQVRGDNEHGSAQVAVAPTLGAPTKALVQIAWDCFGFVFALLCSFYLAVLHLRDWCWEAFGIKNDDDTATGCVLPINEIISLRKRIHNIEYIVSESKKSCLLNQNSSSSSTSKDGDKESKDSSTVKNSAEESTSTQKEIDDLYRSLRKEVIGRDYDRKLICGMLRKGTDAGAASSSTGTSNSVIGIYGITGSGKTTLAQYVCDYEKKACYFNPIMFIHVGKTFSVGNIFRDMMEQITQTRPPNDEGLKSLKTKLKETLEDKCFLLVLDDLWVNDENQNELDILLDMLTLSAAQSGSRVLVTAQKADAAGALGGHLQPFSIPDLEEEVYLSLLMHHAGPFAADDYGKYESIGRKIANRLHRSPIAAVTVGKQLQRNKSISFWETTANLEVLNKTMGALWWSYQQLGVDIRRCYAYCSIFPKGYELERDMLVRIWIAQGFVTTSTEELEDVGQSYFDQLLAFSFLQVHRTFLSTEETFKIHDLLHEFAEGVSGSEFFRVGLNGSPEDIPQGVHHLFIETTDAVEIAEKLVEVGNLRTLIIKKPLELEKICSRNHDSQKLLEHLFMRLTKLRVLIIDQYGSAQFLSVPACIDRMKHLRYLGLCFCSFFDPLILPSTFSKLYHMETIDIPMERASCPEDMANLINLRHIPSWLYIPDIGRLMSLRTMGTFMLGDEQAYKLKQLKHLNKLEGTLVIEGLEIVGSKEEALEAHLTHKKRLRRLHLDFGPWNRFGRDVEAEVLEGLCPPKDLQELCISYYKGSRYPSWMLSRQHPDAPKKLHRLELINCSSQLACIPEGSELFIGLRELQIHECDWDRLPENMEYLVSLQVLLIEDCDEIELLPTLPRQALKTIIIKWCHVLSATCNEEGHENWHKIQHIPEKDIRHENW